MFFLNPGDKAEAPVFYRPEELDFLLRRNKTEYLKYFGSGMSRYVEVENNFLSVLLLSPNEQQSTPWLTIELTHQGDRLKNGSFVRSFFFLMSLFITLQRCDTEKGLEIKKADDV